MNQIRAMHNNNEIIIICCGPLGPVCLGTHNYIIRRLVVRRPDGLPTYLRMSMGANQIIYKTLFTINVDGAQLQSSSNTTYTIGEDRFVSSIKSPILESSSSPTGVSIDKGSLAIFKILIILYSGNSISTANSSGVASRPNFCSN